jgi:acetyl esterase
VPALVTRPGVSPVPSEGYVHVVGYAFDPELVPWLPMFPALDLADLTAIRDAELPPPSYEPPVPLTVRDDVVPGSPDVPVRVYAPADATGPLPCLVYFHPGGFVLGDVAMSEDDAKRLAAEAGVVVVSVAYRLAPENPFPAALDDGYAALNWAAALPATDPARLAVGGESAGGGLSAALALLARDRGGPALCFQYLAIPGVDDRLETPSMRAYVDTPLWNRQAAEFSWDSYLGAGARGTAEVSPYAAPARAPDLSGLPPAFVATCQFDPLRDEGIDYAQRLAQAGVPTELVLYPGTFHGSGMVSAAAVTQRMHADAAAALRRGLHGQLPSPR